MSTGVLKAEPGKLDIKRHSSSIIYLRAYVKLHICQRSSGLILGISLSKLALFEHAGSEYSGETARMSMLG